MEKNHGLENDAVRFGLKVAPKFEFEIFSIGEMSVQYFMKNVSYHSSPLELAHFSSFFAPIASPCCHAICSRCESNQRPVPTFIAVALLVQWEAGKPETC